MYQRRLNYSSKKRKYPYSRKANYGRSNSKYRRANNAGSYFTYDAPRAKSISRLNAAIGSELKQYYHEFKIGAAYTSEAYWLTNPGGTHVYNKPFKMIPAVGGDPPVCAPLPKIEQGQTYSTRIGDKITIKSIDIRMHPEYTPEGTKGGSPGDTAIWIVLDKSPNGVGPTWSDIFHGQTCTPLSQKHMKNENRFQILKTFYLPAALQWFNNDAHEKTYAIGNLTPKFCYYKLKRPMVVKYQSSTTNMVDVVENQIYIIVTTKCATGKLAINGSFNVRYYDS